ncbi:hypothetical protein LEP1GSC193_1156 [Leptospira alstonii serovar Pingchang str. 80-412]|uniref:Uncharacterized protein n=2 Tax=Leptospira alstonii TaxID=28452 RepID=M6CV79_9LEPT|nr:hypothetical protein LEP1GSC194_2814 [Leptospira alstonii serovar Sichuan str. 79601]EQA82484.1 hypothetical protein LEP1GSC193_1156 [Leptospira alstonii serovar Pingchang str. 80-412]
MGGLIFSQRHALLVTIQRECSLSFLYWPQDEICAFLQVIRIVSQKESFFENR